MKKRQNWLAIAALIIFAIACKKEEQPQLQPARYADAIFTETTRETVTYSTAYGLEMDVYQPVGDTETKRPVVVLAHGGGFVGGSSLSPEMVRLGQNLAKRGYVAVSINYRLAPGFLPLLDSNVAADVVVKAIGDARAAIRFLRASVNNGNPFGINPERVFMGGNSAGAVVAVHVGFLDSTDVLPPFFETAMQSNGGFEGNSGNPGHASEVRAVFNMAGGIARTGWIDGDDVPIISFHGVDDDVVPYNCDNVFTGATGGLDVINLCGSKPIHDAALAAGLHSQLNAYPGMHVPWMNANNGEATTLFDEVEQKIFDFLFSQL